MSSVTVKLVPKDTGVGFARALISTSCFKWDLSLRNFEEVHGLSRVVLHVPDKLSVTFEVINALLPVHAEDPGFFINLVVQLCDRYRNLTLTRPPAELAARADKCRVLVFHCDVDSGIQDLGVGNEHLTFPAAIALLRSRLNVAAGLASDARELEFNAEAERLVNLADSVRDLCQIYLDFVHPALILSTRGERDQEAEIQRLYQKTMLLLLEKRGCLKSEFFQRQAGREAVPS